MWRADTMKTDFKETVYLYVQNNMKKKNACFLFFLVYKYFINSLVFILSCNTKLQGMSPSGNSNFVNKIWQFNC